MFKNHDFNKDLMIIDISGVLCQSYGDGKDKFYFWREDLDKKLNYVQKYVDIYFLISGEGYPNHIKDQILARAEEIGACAVLREKVTSDIEMPADFSNVF